MQGMAMRVSEALQYLAETDEDYGRLKGYVAGLEYQIKSAEATGFLEAQGTVGERQAAARICEGYKTLIQKFEDNKIEMEIIGAKRQTAELTIKVWQSQNANKRAGNL